MSASHPVLDLLSSHHHTHTLSLSLSLSLSHTHTHTHRPKAYPRCGRSSQFSVCARPSLVKVPSDKHGSSAFRSCRSLVCEDLNKSFMEALKWVTDQPAWKQSEGRDHILPVHHPWSFKSVRRFMKNAIWLLPDMDSTGKWYKPGQVSLEKDLILPYVPNVDLCDAKCFSDSESKRTTLLFFHGRLKRNAGGKIRAKIGAELSGAEGVVIEEGTAGETGNSAAQNGMRKSIFCLSPAGDTPSSARLFDAIVSGCIPIIVSDELELPFEGILDYRKRCKGYVGSEDWAFKGFWVCFF